MTDDREERCNGFRISLTDEDVARMVLAGAHAVRPSNWSLYRETLLAAAVAAGREIGRREKLEPLDDGLRSVARAAADELVGQGLVGMTHNLYRLDAWMQRYPARGVAEDPPSASD
ncbi:hypothetical protein ACU5AX_09005 [Sphingomonas sp. XXL09]|uniref:hypothetical protein n=1 Tax=Sphingomonas sp. XXL09 TaxID=3457787 RepID=UPI00406BABD3